MVRYEGENKQMMRNDNPVIHRDSIENVASAAIKLNLIPLRESDKAELQMIQRLDP
jgi:hypothetical protein